MAIDLTGFIDDVEGILGTHRLDRPGAYRRWLTPGDGGRDLGCNPYGCADAANILYTIGRFPREPAERAEWVSTLQEMQNPQTGLFTEATHHAIHTTAHCVAALELFDARPRYAIPALDRLKTPAAAEDFLDGLNWREGPWQASHQGAGLYATLAITESVDAAWQDAYFAWLWDHSDPATGLIGKPPITPVRHGETVSLVPHMAGTFHYLFNMQWARRPLRFPAAMIDICIAMLDDGSYPLGEQVSFAEIDWLFCINRASRETDHRFRDVSARVEMLGQRLTKFLLSLDPAANEELNDLHTLLGTLCALAELQQASPGLVRTARPLKLVLDRRPFI